MPLLPLRLRALLRNALVWGAGWSALTLVIGGALRLVGVLPRTLSALDLVGIAIKAAVIGFIAGAAFSGAIMVLWRGRRLADLSWVRVGLGGGVLTGLGLPLFLQAMNVLSGDGPVPWSLVTDDAVIGLVFGGIVSGGSLWLAQRAEKARARLGDGEERRQLEEPDERHG